MSIHSTALVSKDAHISPGASIGPYTVVEGNVTIGEGTIVGAHCVIKGNTTIGKKCEIFTGAVIGDKPQDLKFKGEKSFLEIGDSNIIREYTTINPGTGDGGKTIIGSRNLVMAYAHIAHDCIVGSNCIIANNGTLAGHVVFEDHAMISGLVAVHQFVRVGRMSITGGCSKVVQDIPPYSTCDGHPARVYGLNMVGLRRNGIPAETVKALKNAYREIFNSGLPPKRAISGLSPELLATKEVAYLVEFIQNSPRGITRSCRANDEPEEKTADSTNKVI